MTLIKLLSGFISGILITSFSLYAFNDLSADFKSRKFAEYKIKYPWLIDKRDLFDTIVQEVENNEIDKLIKIPIEDIGLKTALSLVNAESQGNNWRRGTSGERSYWQIMEHHLSKEQRKYPDMLFDMKFSTNLAMKILAENLKRTDGDLLKALNIYNRGNSKLGNIDYLSKIMKGVLE